MKISLVFLVVAWGILLVRGEVRMAKVFSSHMVVQRDQPVHVWGLAARGEVVTVRFRNETAVATADELGRWSVNMRPGQAGGPFQLTASGNMSEKSSCVLDDVMVGDIWIASGQSNMEFELARAEGASEDLRNASRPDLRLLVIKRNASSWIQEDIQSDGWSVSSEATAKAFSAVAWYFARELADREHVAIGVLDATWGGSPVEAWTRVAALAEDPEAAALWKAWGKVQQKQADFVLRQKMYEQDAALAKAAGTPASVPPHAPQIEIWQPGNLYNGMIAPLTRLPMRGVIWYQGEANGDADRAESYGSLFRLMIADWRRQWGISDFPFLYVQLANYRPGQWWPVVRDQQFNSLSVKNTAMAVTVDIGAAEDVHPRDKRSVGYRLSLLARDLVYGETIESSGPIARKLTQDGSSIRVWFDHADGMSAQSGELKGFEVSGEDGKFVAAQAVVDGKTVLVFAHSVPFPIAVRYGWAGDPVCNLYNAAKLPAAPFLLQRPSF